jgi:hypothetical protein
MLFTFMTACQQSGSGGSGGAPALPQAPTPVPPTQQPQDCKPDCADNLRNLYPNQVEYIWKSLASQFYQGLTDKDHRALTGFLLAKEIETDYHLSPDKYTSATFAKLFNALVDPTGQVKPEIDPQEIAKNL